MNTAIENEEDKKEYFDSPEELDMKVTQLVEWMLESSHFVAFTGAGISTGAGIQDFRSGVNTCLETGPGVWEKQAQKIKGKAGKVSVGMHQAFPTKCHMSLVELMNQNMLKYVISQNVDGLHRKSGLDPNKLGELHGNTNLEKCLNCNKDYMRDFRTRNAKEVHDHKTGRFCRECGTELEDSIINFKESLPEKDLDLGFYNCRIADLCLCLGSSLRVYPAAAMPEETLKNGGKIVIVNLQKTPLHDLAALNIFAKIDDVFDLIMQKIGLTIPKWTFSRRLLFKCLPFDETKFNLAVDGIDSNGDPFSLLTSIKLKYNGKVIGECKKEPFEINKVDLPEEFDCLISFESHYSEPDLLLTLQRNNLDNRIYLLDYNPYECKWTDVNAFDYSDFK